jgi:lipid A 3-O-deacylase PagL
MWWFISSVLFSLALLAPTSAQDSKLQRPAFDFWCAGTLSNGHILGFSSGRRLTTCNIGFARRIFWGRRLSIDYAAALTSAAWLSEPAQFDADSFALTSRTRHVFGGGGSPVGIEIMGPAVGPVRLMLESLGGFLYFSQRVLSPRASQFNFTVDIAPSLLISASTHWGFVAGYRYHHMSNANIGDKNPGVDSEILYTGLRFSK